MGSPSIALIGTGFIGPVHVEALRRLGRPIAGLLGSSPARARGQAEALGIVRVYTGLDELLADRAVGSVHITSPNRHHFEQCRRALRAGKHVICEKPLAMSARETAELVAMVEQSQVVAAVCYNVRFYPLGLEAGARIAAGEIGDVFHITGGYVQDWLLYDTDFNWRVLAGEGGALRAVADIGTHWLDLIQFVTGLKIEGVCADLCTMLPERRRPKGSVETFSGKKGTAAETEPVAIDTEDYGSVLLRFGGGA